MKQPKIMEDRTSGASNLDEGGKLELLPGVQLLRNVQADIRVKLEEEVGSVVVGINFYDGDRRGDAATKTFWFEQPLDGQLRPFMRSVVMTRSGWSRVSARR